MIGRRSLPEILVFTLAGFVGLPYISRADVAVVIGVNTYPSLKNANLGGCINDANAMAASLRKRKFRIVSMQDGDATREKVLQKLAELKSTVKPDERFVFYFAGHGSHNPKFDCYLLTSDAEESNFTHTLNRDDLGNAIRDIPAKSRTILLDACYSEGLIRAKGLGFRNRYHQIGPSPKRLLNEGQTDGNENIVAEGLCGFTACARNQPAGEHEFNGGTDHGVFTYYLTQRLDAGKEESWDDTVSAVSALVAEDRMHEQTPIFAPVSYRKYRIFEGSGAAPPTPPRPKRTLWEDYVDNKSDPNFLKIAFEPADSAVKVGTLFKMSVTTGAEGYLVILNKDATDRIYLFYPDSQAHATVDQMVASAHVKAGPQANFKIRPLDLGTERLKAILFRDEQSARDLISKVPAEGLTMEELRSRARVLKLEGRESGDWDYYTAMKQVDVVPKDAATDN
jgi:hypothetical protein